MATTPCRFPLCMRLALLGLATASVSLAAQEDLTLHGQDGSVIVALVSGLNRLSDALEEHHEKCLKKGALTPVTEEHLDSLRERVRRQWAELGDLERNFGALTSKMSQMLRKRVPYARQELKGCVPPFYEVGGGCYWLHKRPGLSWDDARRRCQRAEADLATPGNMLVLRDYLRKQQNPSWSNVWVGGRVTAWGNWRWLNNSAIVMNERTWYPVSRSFRADCVALAVDQDFLMTGVECDKNLYFLCEKKL
ncbi:uncharacterized protein LOC134771514 [Penaeus indicus]|uniref:uncharacterized protein LOC134771514 n=1 Tax=Penaeus indicus TaxID=29960 RepID=UPI00300D754E